MRPADVYAFRSVGEPRLSPDGRYVAYVVNWIDAEANGYRGAIWVAPPDGSEEPRQFPSGERRDGSPRWSPDGTRLLVTVCGPFGACRLDVAAADGSGVTRLGPGSDPAWSPDGSRIAFVQRRSCPGWSVFVARADGTGLRRITPCR